jgi:cephalosporin-C deacetylase-like acetyl esterase
MSYQRRSLAIVAALAALFTPLAVGASGSPRQLSPRPTVTPLKPSRIYAVGEKAGWTVSFPPIDGPTPGPLSYEIRKNNLDVIQSGEIDPAKGSATVQITLNEPAMLMLQLKAPGSNRGPRFGAAVAPRDLKPVVPRPKDFDAFWRSKIKELEKVPANPVVTPGESGRADVEFSTLKMDHVNGTHIYGQMAKPKRAGKFPAMLVLQWASPPYPLDKSWVLGPASQGWLVLNIEPHDVPTDAPRAFYAGLPNEVKHYESIGSEDRDKSYFVEMYLRDYRAAEYLAHCPDWDGKTLVVTGGSMGGQQSLCVAGLYPKITHVVVEEPAGCDLQAGLHGRQEGYPFFPVNNPKVMATVPYVDAVNFASRIHATSLVAMGFKDDVAPPAGIWTAFNQIRGPKEVAPMPDAPHNNTATQEEQMPYYRRMGAWFGALVKGEKVVPDALAGMP